MILVTGGTGLVGSHLLFKLIQQGENVKATYRTQKKLDHIKQVFSYYTDDAEAVFNAITWVEADITTVPELSEAFTDVTHVYHCAALISFDPNDYYRLRKVNIEGTANVVNLCLSHGIKKLCYVSSIAALGSALNKPVTEKTPWNPDLDHNVYAITKYGAELEVWRATQEGLDAVIVNPGVIIGPGFWHTGSGSLFKKIKKGMSHYVTGVTGYVDIHDVVNIMEKLMTSDLVNENYTVIAENLSFKTFMELVSKNIDAKMPKKEASKFLLQIAWRLDWLRSKLKNKPRRLTRHTAMTASTKKEYSNQKVVNALGYTFTGIEKSVTVTSEFFKKSF